MDFATILGLLLAFGSLYAMIALEGANVSSLLLPAPMIFVLGATIAVGIASGKLSDALRAFGALPHAFIGRTPKPADTIATMVELTTKARIDGLLGLEEEASKTKDDFLRVALQNLANGTDYEVLERVLDEEVHSRSRAEKNSAKYFKMLGGYAPTIGIVGTVVSLTHVLENLDAPETLGHSIAAAFVATLWGLLSANFIWLPLGDRLARLAGVNEDNRIIIMQGALAIQAGRRPRDVHDLLSAMLPPADRAKTSRKAKAPRSPAGAS